METSNGPDLELIQTERIGFLALAGDAKVQLTSKWSEFPAPTASLISIASRKALVAAAGPDAIHIATTESVRKAFEIPKDGDSDIRSFQPTIKLPLPMRISQLAFTADEKYLILSAETGGGLAVYDVQSLSNGSTKTEFELSTNGETLRSLIPNPMAEKAELCAMVTNNGNLLMANLSERVLVQTSSGQTLKSQISCAAWSSKGKQLVAGSADGSVFQMTPDGQEKAHIPKPPKLGDYHVASIAWLENDVFLVIHNPANGDAPSSFHIVTRHNQAGSGRSFVFQKLSDPVEPYGDKAPHHSFLRLRDFPPNILDLLIVSSTAVENIGLLTRSKTPLTNTGPQDKIANVFTTTELADDSRRAQVPMAEDYSETFPIGTALDLSGKDKVYKPIPTDEMDESPGPLPGLWVLNNDGVLASWWVVYDESIRAGTTYPGLVAVEGSAAPQPLESSTQKAAPFGTPVAAAPAFGGSPALGSSPSPWASKPAATSNPPSGSPFGTVVAAAPAFGGSSALGGSTSPWASKPAGTSNPPGGSLFGTPSFGAPSFGKPSAFGQASTIGVGMRTSPWAAGSAAPAGPAFGQTGFATSGTPPANPFASKSAAPANPFSSATTSSPASGGFAGFANKGGFAALAPETTGRSIFESTTPTTTPAPSKFRTQDIPLPPDTISKAAYPLGESSSSSVVVPEDAPLPPDPFLKPKPKQSATPDVSAPPNPFASMKPLGDGPALPNPFAHIKPPSEHTSDDEEYEDELSEEGEVEEDEEDHGEEGEEQEQEDQDEEEVEDGDVDGEEADEDGLEEGEEADEEGLEEGEVEKDSEGSGVDVGKDLSPTTTTGFGPTPGFTPQSSFAGMAGSVFSATSRPEEPISRLFGEINLAPQYYPPQQASPRSPSPQRRQPPIPAANRLQRSDAPRSVSAPGMASQILGGVKKAGPSTLGMPVTGRASPAPDVNVEERRKADAKRQADEGRLLVDDDYENVERQLDATIEPTLQMPECVYLMGTEVQGDSSIASQTEAVYRDINRMVQSLKANARNLQAFIAGHAGQARNQPAPEDKDDLEFPEDWILCDVDTCGRVLTEDLAQELADSRARQSDDIKKDFEELLKETARLRALRDDMTKIIEARSNPNQVAATKSLPLSVEQSAQQNDLRRRFTKFSNQLTEAEQSLTLLKAKLVSINSASGKGGASGPTVEAVMRTINKLTTMAEKRSGDIDVLETQMRKLGLDPGSREASPFVSTPQKRASTFSPGSTHKSLTSSVTSLGPRATPPRKKMSGFSEKEKIQLRQKLASRKQTLDGLKKALKQSGPVYMSIGEDDDSG